MGKFSFSQSLTNGFYKFCNIIIIFNLLYVEWKKCFVKCGELKKWSSLFAGQSQWDCPAVWGSFLQFITVFCNYSFLDMYQKKTLQKKMRSYLCLLYLQGVISSKLKKSYSKWWPRLNNNYFITWNEKKKQKIGINGSWFFFLTLA